MKRLIALLLILSAGLTGCHTADTPSKALLLATKAITDNNLNDLNEAIAWQAKTDYGSRAGLAKLRAASRGDKITLGTVLTTGGPIYHEDRVWQYYSGRLYAGGRPYIDAEVICASEDVSGDRSTSSSAVMVTYCFVSKVGLK